MPSAKRILLTQPICGYVMELFQGFPIPLAPLAAASWLEPEFDVEIFDQRLHPLNWRAELDRALASRPLLVGFSAMVGPSSRRCRRPRTSRLRTRYRARFRDPPTCPHRRGPPHGTRSLP